jgi:hypothetical protein
MSALHGGEWLASHSNCFIPKERTLVLIEGEAGWAAELVWSVCGEEKNLALPETEPRLSRVADLYVLYVLCFSILSMEKDI